MRLFDSAVHAAPAVPRGEVRLGTAATRVAGSNGPGRWLQSFFPRSHSGAEVTAHPVMITAYPR